MKSISKALCVAFILSVLISMLPFEAECSDISTQVFRLHILANSDENTDQQLKLKVRDEILKYTNNLYNKAETKEDTIAITGDNLENILKIAQNTVKESGFNYKISGKITKDYFTTRYYENITMPSGYYDTLEIKIGSGNGKNWWCVMYPTLCIGSAADDSKLKNQLSDSQYQIVSGEDKYEFKFKIVEYYEKFISYFR